MALLLLLGAGVVDVRAQGKVSLQNDGGSPITLAPSWDVLGSDFGVAGQPVATTGPLPSGIMLRVGLYAGRSSTALSLVSSEVMNPVGGGWPVPGIITPLHIVLPFPGGSVDYFQVRVWDNAFTNYEQAALALSYFGENNIFTMTPGWSISYPPINGGGGSTWTAVGNETPLIVGGGEGYDIYITSQPLSQTVARGGTAYFSVGAFKYDNGDPLRYNWYRPSATNSWYVITNVQPADAGPYAVLVYDTYASVLSAPAMLTVLLPPPTIITAPQSQTAELGARVGFDIRANGDLPFRYQWFFNATNALGTTTTNSHLQLDKAQFSQSGAYTVVVTNGGGAVTSPPALLSIIAAVERRPAAALDLTGVLNSPLNLDYTPLLDPPINWLPLDSVLLTNPAQQYVDASSVLVPQRFYRGWQTNGPPSILALNMVPAVTLTGNIGDHLRLDYINQFGPIDAWVTLDTVTLTNTTQLYFDTSVIGQPARLYRIVPVP